LYVIVFYFLEKVYTFPVQNGSARIREIGSLSTGAKGILSLSLSNHSRGAEMKELTRITFDPDVMGGKPCIRGMRVTVGTIIGLLATGHNKEEVLKLYPYLEPEDVEEARRIIPAVHSSIKVR
jgi:uncharacterized protein (DUF433 family)